MTLDNLFWLILLGAAIFMMTRKGGCCGGHGSDPSSKDNHKEDT
jgi:hypothetical protein